MKTIKKRKQCMVLAILFTITCCLSNHFLLESHAANTDKTQQKLTEDLSDLKNKKAAVSKQLSSATNNLNSLVVKTEKTQKELALSQAREIGHYELMQRRIQYFYELGSGDLLSVLCEAESMSDFLNKAEFISTVSAYDREMLKKLQTIHKNTAKKQKLLETQQQELLKQKQTLAATYSELTSMVASKSDELKAYQKKLAEAEEARKKAEALAAQKEEQENQSNSTEKPSKPNSPSKPAKPNKPVQKPSKPANPTDLALFAGILECEAGSSDYEALLAVATVVMNRVESPRYPNTLRGVIYQSGQFSPTWTGFLDRILARGPKPLCYRVAKDALAGKRHQKVLNCYQFRASFTGHKGIIIGDNVFF